MSAITNLNIRNGELYPRHLISTETFGVSSLSAQYHLNVGTNAWRGDAAVSLSSQVTDSKVIGVTGGNSEVFTVLTGGNIGIGTAAPADLVDSYGGIRISKDSAAAGALEDLAFIGCDSAGNKQVYACMAGCIVDGTSTQECGHLILSTAKAGTITEYVRLTEAGSVGIGTNNPCARLNVYGGDICSNCNLVIAGTSCLVGAVTLGGVITGTNVCASQCLCAVGCVTVGGAVIATGDLCTAADLCAATNLVVAGTSCSVGDICGGADVHAATCIVSPALCASTLLTGAELCSAGAITVGGVTCLVGCVHTGAEICVAANICTNQCFIATTVICTAGAGGAVKNCFAGCLEAGIIKSGGGITAAGIICTTTCICTGACIHAAGTLLSAGFVCGECAYINGPICGQGIVLGTNVCASQCLCAVGDICTAKCVITACALCSAGTANVATTITGGGNVCAGQCLCAVGAVCAGADLQVGGNVCVQTSGRYGINCSTCVISPGVPAIVGVMKAGGSSQQTGCTFIIRHGVCCATTGGGTCQFGGVLVFELNCKCNAGPFSPALCLTAAGVCPVVSLNTSNSIIVNQCVYHAYCCVCQSTPAAFFVGRQLSDGGQNGCTFQFLHGFDCAKTGGGTCCFLGKFELQVNCKCNSGPMMQSMLWCVGGTYTCKQFCSVATICTTQNFCAGIDINAPTKTFMIPHPCCETLCPNKYNNMTLRHGVSEGPEYNVFYRGTGRLCDGIAVVNLPEYFEKLTALEDRTIQLTSVGGWSPLVVKERVSNGKFVVCTTDNGKPCQEFDWRVDARRNDEHVRIKMHESGVTDIEGRLIPEQWKMDDVLRQENEHLEFLDILSKSEMISILELHKKKFNKNDTKEKLLKRIKEDELILIDVDEIG